MKRWATRGGGLCSCWSYRRRSTNTATGRIRDALADLDHRWIASALDALRRRDVARVTVIANDHRLSLGSRDPWKLWRMPRPALTALQ